MLLFAVVKLDADDKLGQSDAVVYHRDLLCSLRLSEFDICAFQSWFSSIISAPALRSLLAFVFFTYLRDIFEQVRNTAENPSNEMPHSHERMQDDYRQMQNAPK